VGCGHRVFHAVARRHHPQHRPARHGQGLERKPAAHARRDRCLHAYRGPADPCLGLDCRPLRHQENLLQRHSAVQFRLVALCAVQHPQRVDWRTDHPGPGRCADAAHRTAGGAQGLPALGVGADHGVYHHPGPARSIDRPHDGRLDGAVPELALDFPDQSAGGRSGLLGSLALHSGPARQRAHPLRRAGFRAVWRRDDIYHHCDGGAGRVAHAALARDVAALRRDGVPGGLLVAGGQYQQPAVLAGTVQNQNLCGGHSRQPVCSPGQRRATVPGAVAAASGSGLLAVTSRDEHAATGRSRHAGQVDSPTADRARGVSHRTHGQHLCPGPDAGQHGPGHRTDALPAVAVNAGRFGGDQLVAVHRDEYRHPDRPR